MNTNNIVLSNSVSTSGNYSLTFTYPLTLAPTWESGNVASGSNKVTGLEQPIGATGDLTKNSNAITDFSSSSHVAVGDWVTAPGIPANTYITQIQSDQSILLSNVAGANDTQEQLTISAPLAVGEPVSGAGIPPKTTIASISSGTSITLSNNATATATLTTLCFGTSSFAGPTVSGTGVPAGDSIASIVSGSSVSLAQNASKTEPNVR